MPDGLTRPLHMACASGYEKAATLLLDHHADIGAIGPKGHRPLHLAAKEERAVIVEVRKNNDFKIVCLPTFCVFGYYVG